MPHLLASLRLGAQTLPLRRASAPCPRPLSTARGSRSWLPVAQHATDSDGPSTSSTINSSTLGATALWYWVALVAPVSAAEEVVYNAGGREEFLTNAAGVAYVMLVTWFLYRVLKRRAKRFKEQKISETPSLLGDGPSWFDQMRDKLLTSQPERESTAWDAVIGAIQAGAIAAGLFIFSDKMQTLIENASLPDGYTARNISITVRTIILGLGWLITFIFAANSVGLAALSVQWFLFPDSVKDPAASAAARRAAGPQLPQVSVISSRDEIRKAFEAAERIGKAEASASLSVDGGLEQGASSEKGVAAGSRRD